MLISERRKKKRVLKCCCGGIWSHFFGHDIKTNVSDAAAEVFGHIFLAMTFEQPTIKWRLGWEQLSRILRVLALVGANIQPSIVNVL